MKIEKKKSIIILKKTFYISPVANLNVYLQNQEQYKHTNISFNINTKIYKHIFTYT